MIYHIVYLFLAREFFSSHKWQLIQNLFFLSHKGFPVLTLSSLSSLSTSSLLGVSGSAGGSE